MSCCGRPVHEISLRTGAGPLSMVHCSHCGTQSWLRGGDVVEREDALADLAAAFGGGQPRLVPARSPGVPRSAARRAQPAAAPVAQPTRSALSDLLQGWQVHGASTDGDAAAALAHRV